MSYYSESGKSTGKSTVPPTNSTIQLNTTPSILYNDQVPSRPTQAHVSCDSTTNNGEDIPMDVFSQVTGVRAQEQSTADYPSYPLRTYGNPHEPRDMNDASLEAGDDVSTEPRSRTRSKPCFTLLPEPGSRCNCLALTLYTGCAAAIGTGVAIIAVRGYCDRNHAEWCHKTLKG